MSRKGFTLIEVMVVLSVLAIIAILAYNFFGSTMKEATVTQAATKVTRDLNVLADAIELYLQASDEGKLPAGYDYNDIYAYGSNTFAGITHLTDAGVAEHTHLKSVPMPPSNARLTPFAGACWGSDSYQDYYQTINYEDLNSDGSNDISVAATGISVDVCNKINEMAGHPTMWDFDGNGGTYPTPMRSIMCYTYNCAGVVDTWAVVPVRY